MPDNCWRVLHSLRLLVAYLVASALRMAQGSATVAIITAAGIVSPLVKDIPGQNAELLVLATCAGGTILSARQRLGILDRESASRHDGSADAAHMDGDESDHFAGGNRDCYGALRPHATIERMPEQDYKNHVRRVPGFLALALILVVTFIGAAVNLYESLSNHERLYSASLILVLTGCLFATAGYGVFVRIEGAGPGDSRGGESASFRAHRQAVGYAAEAGADCRASIRF